MQSMRAYVEWANIHTQKDWDNIVRKSQEKLQSGAFLAERLGYIKESDPELVAVLLLLRTSWVEEYQIQTAPEFILIDMSIINYYHFLRLNELAGNAAALIETGFFLGEAPSLYWKKESGKIMDKLEAEEHIRNAAQKVLPLIDEYQRMFIRSLKALRDLKRTNLILNINQMNIGEKQINIKKDMENQGKKGL